MTEPKATSAQAELNQANTVRLLESLADRTERATDAALKLAEIALSGQKAAEAREAHAIHQDKIKTRRFWITMGGIFLIVIAIGVVMIVFLVKISTVVDKVKTSTAASSDARATILDCVVPGGKCYNRSQAQTATILDQLNIQGIARGVCLQEEAHVVPLLARDIAVKKCEIDLLRK
jgi:hypothetical protein